MDTPLPEVYAFTREELNDLLTDAIEMFLEYRNKYDYTEQGATYAAVQEELEGINFQRELAGLGECKYTEGDRRIMELSK